MIKLHCGDCLSILRAMGTNSVDVLVTDPPYGISADRKQGNRANRRHGAALAPSKDYGLSNWDASRPSADVFAEMLRVAKHAVIFGGNYFADLLPPSSGWIVWDKDNGANNYADFELAWTSRQKAARKIKWRWHGMLQEPGHPKDKRVHPTQKPLGLMRWVIQNYSQPNDLILDPFTGSGTTGVACALEGRNFIGIERDANYFKIAKQRIAEASRMEVAA